MYLVVGENMNAVAHSYRCVGEHAASLGINPLDAIDEAIRIQVDCTTCGQR